MSDHASPTASHAAGHDAHDQPHALPLRVLVSVFVLLLVLTFITVAVTWVDLGPLNIWVALFIAVLKGAAVALYFMHLRYDAPFNGVVLVASFLFVMLFIGAALTDSAEYQETLEPPSSVPTTTP